MATKLQRVSELADQTAHDITNSVSGWKSYLTTASRLYRYPFDEQLLIYAQRPDATACASIELWNGRMRRWVKPRSKGIALIRKDGGGRPHLEYVFDVSDTRAVQGAKTPYLWALKKDHHAAVMTMMERRYGPTEETDIGWALMEQVSRAVNEVYRDHLEDLRYDAQDSLLEEFDDLNLEVRFRNILTASVQYAVLTRCGLDPADYLEDVDLAGIIEFSTPAVLHHLGVAASAVSGDMLNEIGRTVRKYERESLKNKKKNIEKTLANSSVIGYTEGRGEFNAVKRESEERSMDHGGTDIHPSGGLPDSCQRQLENVGFRRKGMSFFAGQYTSVYSLNHHITCRFEARQALIYQLVLGLTGENDMYNYSKAVHVYPPFFDITCSAKNYKIAPALTPNRTYPHEWDFKAAERDILPLLNDPEKSAALYENMVKTMATISPDDQAYARMEPALKDMGAFVRGDYSLFTSLPEAVLEAERQAKQAAKEKQKDQRQNSQSAVGTASKTPEAPKDRLAAAAHALAKKSQTAAQEDQYGQFDLFSMASTAPVEPEPPAPSSEHTEPSPVPETAAPPKDTEKTVDSQAHWWDEYNEIKKANPDSIVLYQTGDFFEMYGEDAKTTADILDLNLTTRPIAGVGQVERCNFPAQMLFQYVNQLREKYDVTVVPAGARTGERQPYTMLSFDNEARQAIDQHEAEYGADGTRVFRDMEAEAGATETLKITAALGDKTTVRELYEHYKPVIKDKVLADVAYQNACCNSDRENAVLEGNEAVKRAALTMMEDTTFLRLY